MKQLVPRSILVVCLTVCLAAVPVLAQTAQTAPTAQTEQPLQKQSTPAQPPATTPAAEQKPETPAKEAGTPQPIKDATTAKPMVEGVPPKQAEPIPPAEAVADQTPTTTLFPAARETRISDKDLLAPPPMPRGKISLLGGTVRSIDQVRNRMTVEFFGKGRMKMFFDERSRFFKSGVEGTQLVVRKGDRVYVDSQLEKGKIFARRVQVENEIIPADANGQVESLNLKKRTITLRDQLTTQAVTFNLATNAVITQQGKTITQNDLRRDSLVALRFVPGSGKRGLVSEINVLATPGSEFTFQGRLTHLDLRSGILALNNKSDDRLYEIKFAPASAGVNEDWKVGADVTVVAAFNGKDYTARAVKINAAAGESEFEEDSDFEENKDGEKDKKDKKKKDKDKDEDDGL